MPISMTIAVTTLLGVLAAAQHIYNLPDTSAKAAKQAEKQARYDAKHQQFLRDLEVERQAKNYSARDFSNRQYEVEPEATITPTITTQPGFRLQIATPVPAQADYSAQAIGNRLGEVNPSVQTQASEANHESESEVDTNTNDDCDTDACAAD